MENTELLQAIYNDLQSVKQDVSGLKQGQEILQQDVSGLKQGQEILQQDVSGLKQGQVTLQTDMTEIKQRTTKIEVILENDISKKLDSLFIGNEMNTKKLFKLDSIEKTVEATKDTVDIMFTVIKKHSGEIKELHLAK